MECRVFVWGIDDSQFKFNKNTHTYIQQKHTFGDTIV